MWLMVISVPLLPAIAVLSSRCGARVAALWRRAVSWAWPRLAPPRASARSAHAFVFSNCTHGNVDSVLQTFDLHAATQASLCVSTRTGEALEEVVRRVRPSRVLELGMHCGYTSVRLLRLLPPAGTLLTVELDPPTAEMGEEIILVAGFKHSQFQVLTSSSAEAIPTLRQFLEPHAGSSEGLDLVLMDHDPQEYLPDLRALEREEVLCPSGCSVLFIHRNPAAEDFRGVLHHIRAKPDCYSIRSQFQFMTEIFYQKENMTVDSKI